MPDEVVRVIYQVDGTAAGKRGVDALADSVDRSTGAAARAQSAFGGLSSSLMGYLGFRSLLGDVRDAGASRRCSASTGRVARTSTPATTNPRFARTWLAEIMQLARNAHHPPDVAKSATEPPQVYRGSVL